MTDITIKDAEQRQRALEPTHSFIVQAPAGSGKTELLTQRFLLLLQSVNVPEEILAITFTKKSCAEMLARIIKALQKAATQPEPTSPHEKKTWHLAKRALQQDQTLGWHLLENPNRLRIQTMDSFNASLIKHLPILSHFGAPPEIADDPYPLYREAVQEFLTHLEENVAWSDAIATLLMHLDNDLGKVEGLLINMLAKRDQWLPYIMLESDQPTLRQELEFHLASVVTDILSVIDAHFPKQHEEELLTLIRYAAQQIRILGTDKIGIASYVDITTLPSDQETWSMISKLLLTLDLSWRKSFDKNIGFPSASSAENSVDKALFKEMKQRMETLVQQLSTHEKFHSALMVLSYSPTSHYQENQWQVLHALYQVLRVVVAQLKVTFRQYGKIDYIENAQAALHALGPLDSPTDLALALDYQIKHILIDEFQDTSNSQYRLIEKLTAGWESYDGRTLFVVGDPMQSIYRFREAEVGLFIRARKHGIGHLPLEPLTLSVNFRSTPVIVNWVNEHFNTVLPPFEDIATGAVSYSPSIANQTSESSDSHVKLHSQTDSQADAIIQLIQQCKKDRPEEKIAILVRARTHLEAIVPALKKANLSYRAIKIDPLDSRPVIQDLMALTHALLNLADRVAWLALLRAPWCGLSLADLFVISNSDAQAAIWDRLNQLDVVENCSKSGKIRIAHILPILTAKIAERQRHTLRLWVESTWILLGGPACLNQASDLDDVMSYFGLLEKMDQGGYLKSPEDLVREVSKLFAAPNTQADDSLQIMTIHNAKGLEFDTVILPHLEKQAPHEQKQLLLWMEKPRDNANSALILAPVRATGDENDSIYDYIKKQHAIKFDHELGRLLYVAATRAKKQLHLFFTPLTSQEKSNPNATAKSLVEKLWPAIKNIVAPLSVTDIVLEDEAAEFHTVIKRLTSGWTNPIREIAPEKIKVHQTAPGFSLSQDDAKQLGTLTHRILENIARNGIAWWQKKNKDQAHVYIKNQILQLGILPAKKTAVIERVYEGICLTLKDAKGLWILQPHRDAQTEFALTVMNKNEVTQHIIDRTFVDDTGTRWIIDYKSIAMTGKDLQKFLDSEQAQYAEKMAEYAQAMRLMHGDEVIKLGLYFPLISAWREWIG